MIELQVRLPDPPAYPKHGFLVRLQNLMAFALRMRFTVKQVFVAVTGFSAVCALFVRVSAPEAITVSLGLGGALAMLVAETRKNARLRWICSVVGAWIVLAWWYLMYDREPFQSAATMFVAFGASWIAAFVVGTLFASVMRTRTTPPGGRSYERELGRR